MSDERVTKLDALVSLGTYKTRAAVVRDAVDRLLETFEEEAIDRAIVEGYTRMPQTEDEVRWAASAARRSVAEEPW